MQLLAEVSDKIVSTGQFWTVSVMASTLVQAIAVASRSWHVLLVAVPLSALGCLLTLSLLDDPVFGDAILQECGWPWFASNFAASLLPVVMVIVTLTWARRRRPAVGFEVVQSGCEALTSKSS